MPPGILKTDAAQSANFRHENGSRIVKYMYKEIRKYKERIFFGILEKFSQWTRFKFVFHLSIPYGRDFYFKHADARSGKDKSIKRVNLVLNDGLLLLMEKPTNRFWYHALPRRKNSPGTRINLTFRKVK